MDRPRRSRSCWLTGALVVLAGCTQAPPRRQAGEVDGRLGRAAYEASDPVTAGPPLVLAWRSEPDSADLTGPQPVEVFIHRALAENRTVQAAYHNVQSLKARVPQVMTLDDPVLSNTIFPIPSVAPQYSLMGYNPYNVTLAQQFPWCGTLRLRGEAAERDVQVALAELAAAQLDAVAAVKRAYDNLYAGLEIEEVLRENRAVLEDFRAIARERLSTGGTQQDVIRAGTLLSELDRSLAENQQGIASARAALARQVHLRPDTAFRTLPSLSLAAVPTELDRLMQLAVATRPELRGRLAAVARDEKAVELARLRFYPGVTLGLTIMDMSKTNAVTPQTASGTPNIGLFVAFNLPVYRAKYQAGVCEAQQRTLADARLYEAQCDETASEIQESMVQVKTQQGVLALLRDSILPRAKESFELARSDYAKTNVDYATVQSALREVLQVRLQIAQVEAEMGKAIAGLERAVGCEINEHPPAPTSDAGTTPATPPPAAPPPPARSGPPARVAAEPLP